MLFRTHLLLSVFFILLFLSFVDSKIIFVAMCLIGTLIPDIDSSYSKIGKPLIFRPMQFFVKHRGFFHSITFAALISIGLALFFPVASFGFFLGYALHVVGDSFTKEGVRAFWPLKLRSHGFIQTGGISERILFFCLIVADIFLLVIVVSI